jgi:hypothetical protein
VISQSTIVFFYILVAFLLYIAQRGELGQYLALLYGGGTPAPSPPGSQPSPGGGAPANTATGSSSFPSFGAPSSGTLASLGATVLDYAPEAAAVV